MVDLEGRDLQTVVFENRLRAIAGLRTADGEGAGDERGCLERCDLRAVVRGAMRVVDGVGLVESGHDPLDPCAAMDRQGATAPADPGLHSKLAEVADVIGVQVREQYGRDPVRWKIRERERLPRFRAGIDDIGALAGNDDRARLGAGGIGERRRGSAEDDAQRLAVEQVGGAALLCEPAMDLLIVEPSKQDRATQRHCGAGADDDSQRDFERNARDASVRSHSFPRARQP